MKIKRIYLDTSVYGGCFDDEFCYESKLLFKKIINGEFKLIVSDTTQRELLTAPHEVKEIIQNIPIQNIELVEINNDILTLRNAYIKSGVLGKSSIDDAEHIACATYANADFVVSWNFKHIVHYEKIAGYNSVNLINGYKTISIYSPKEVV